MPLRATLGDSVDCLVHWEGRELGVRGQALDFEVGFDLLFLFGEILHNNRQC